MKKNYIVPQSTALQFNLRESVMMQTSNAVGNGVQLSNKHEYDDDNASDGSPVWSSDYWSDEGEK